MSTSPRSSPAVPPRTASASPSGCCRCACWNGGCFGFVVGRGSSSAYAPPQQPIHHLTIIHGPPSAHQVPGATTYMGSVGKDEYGSILAAAGIGTGGTVAEVSSAGTCSTSSVYVGSPVRS